MADFGSIKQLIERVAESVVTYINFEKTELERDSTFTTIDTTINELHKNIENNKRYIMSQKDLLNKGGFDFKSEEGLTILKLLDTMVLYQNEIEWRGVMIDVLHTYMTKYYEALEGAKGISQSAELVQKQQEYLTIMFDSMKEVFKEQVESGFEQRKLEFGALLQRFEFLTDRIRINDVILNKCVDTIKDQKNEIAGLAESITAKYEIKKIYTCSHCWKEFNSKAEMEEHAKTHLVNRSPDPIKEEQKDIEKDIKEKDTLAYNEQIKDDISDFENISQIKEPVFEDMPKELVNEKPIDVKSGFENAIEQEQTIKKEDVLTDSPWNSSVSDSSIPNIPSNNEQIVSKVLDISKNNIVNDIKKNKEMQKERRKHLKMLGKELKRSIKYKNKMVEYLIKQGKYSDEDIITITECSTQILYLTRKKMSNTQDTLSFPDNQMI